MFVFMVVPKIDLKYLRRLTEVGIARRQVRQTKLDSGEITEEERQGLRAQEIIDVISALAEVEAQRGNRRAEVMMVMGSEFDPEALRQQSQHEEPFEVKNVKAEWLSGAARIVWDYCCQSGLRPTLKSWAHQGMGAMCGYAIVVHW